MSWDRNTVSEERITVSWDRITESWDRIIDELGQNCCELLNINSEVRQNYCELGLHLVQTGLQ